MFLDIQHKINITKRKFVLINILQSFNSKFLILVLIELISFLLITFWLVSRADELSFFLSYYSVTFDSLNFSE